jgi:wyosine [tRNA(Phe)-imidazoG37] synthetase (radical SAM superfamily)
MKITSAELKPEDFRTVRLPQCPLTVTEKPIRNTVSSYGRAAEFLGNRFVYAMISQRAHGLSIGINLNPDKSCNFDCAYCEVNRDRPARDSTVDLEVLAGELEGLLKLTHERRLRQFTYFQHVPEELLALKGVALSGEGEPTLSAQFAEIMREVIHVRSHGRFPFFKLVLITNASGLDLPSVREGLKLLTSGDEIWAKLDGGTQEYMNVLNRTDVNLEKILANILRVGRERSIIIQSLFPLLNGREPSVEEIDCYVGRLWDLKKNGAKISLVQIYSAHRPPHRPESRHLPLKSLSRIAQRVRQSTGLRAEVF